MRVKRSSNFFTHEDIQATKIVQHDFSERSRLCNKGQRFIIFLDLSMIRATRVANQSEIAKIAPSPVSSSMPPETYSVLPSGEKATLLVAVFPADSRCKRSPFAP